MFEIIESIGNFSESVETFDDFSEAYEFMENLIYKDLEVEYGVVEGDEEFEEMYEYVSSYYAVQKV